jgi:hypothetical protein
VAPIASADEPRVGVLPFTGPGSAKARGGVVAALRQNGATVVDAGELRSTAQRLGADLSEPGQRSDISRMARVDAFIDGKVERERGQHVLTLTITNGADGDTLEVTSLSARNVGALSRLARKNGWELIEPSLLRARRAEEVAAAEPEPVDDEPAPTEPEEDPAEEPEESDDDEAGDEAEPDDEDRPSPLLLELGIAGFSRVLEYRENIDRLPRYEIALPPAVRGTIVWYPGAHFSSGVAAHFGLRLHGQYAFGLSSAVDDQHVVPGRWAARAAGGERADGRASGDPAGPRPDGERRRSARDHGTERFRQVDPRQHPHGFSRVRGHRRLGRVPR